MEQSTNNPLDEKFLLAASPPDSKGRINLRIEKALEEELRDIADDERYPLHSISQVVRFCCLEGLELIRDWQPSKNTLLAAIRAANAIALRDKMQADAEDLLDRVGERVQWYIARDYFDEAIAFVGEIQSHFAGLEKSFWKEHILKEIDTRFEQWYAQIEHQQLMQKRNEK